MTLDELRSVYSLGDLCDYHLALDLEAELMPKQGKPGAGGFSG